MKQFKIMLVLAGLWISGGFASGQIRIAVSKASDSYVHWLKQADSTVVIVNMYPLGCDSALSVLSSCSGLLLTGGEDVYPGYYGKLKNIGLCEDIDRYRDSLEMDLIAKAYLMQIPIFGICRGDQILNVALGGSLIMDIPTEVGLQVIHRCPPGSANCLHAVTLDTTSQLFRITGIRKGIVNSFHHQAVEYAGKGLRITAVSDDGVAEAVERADTTRKPFIMAVQWHPERLITDNPSLSLPLARYFLEQARGR